MTKRTARVGDFIGFRWDFKTISILALVTKVISWAGEWSSYENGIYGILLYDSKGYWNIEELGRVIKLSELTTSWEILA